MTSPFRNRKLHLFSRSWPLLGLCASLALASCQSTPKVKGIAVTTQRLQSGGKTVRVERFRSESAAGTTKTAVIVLHGAGGMVFDGPEMRRTAQALALAGHDVYVPHYFNRTGNLVTFDKGMTRNFATWAGTVRDTVKWVRTTEGQPGKIGLFGYSLGGFLTMAEALHDPNIAAAVVHAGGIWDGYGQNATHLPPLLLVHGTDDTRVGFKKYSHQMESFLKARGGKYETAYYPGQGHRFDEASLIKVRAQAVSFLNQKLK